MIKKIVVGVFLLFVIQTGFCASNNNNNAMLFVSLGMPKLVLRQYLVQSKEYGIPIVIRGLIDNSTPKTMSRLYEILHPKNKAPIKAGIEIDPTWFKQFDIKVVPALVLNKNGQSCIVYGNLKMANLLKIMHERCHSDVLKNLASHYLERASV